MTWKAGGVLLQCYCFGPFSSQHFVIVNRWQAMEEHRVRQARIVDALEEEKKKISRELEEMQRKRAVRENQTPRHGERLGVPQICLVFFRCCLANVFLV